MPQQLGSCLAAGVDSHAAVAPVSQCPWLLSAAVCPRVHGEGFAFSVKRHFHAMFHSHKAGQGHQACVPTAGLLLGSWGY